MIEAPAMPSATLGAESPDALGVVTWRCPRCGRIANRMMVGDADAVVTVEHKCKCGALSTARIGDGIVVVVRGRMAC